MALKSSGRQGSGIKIFPHISSLLTPARGRKKNGYTKIIICLALEITSHIIFLIYSNFQER
jgi:hypothetical protein